MLRTRRLQKTYGNLEIYHLLCECAHLVAEAEAVLAHVIGREDKVALALLVAVENKLVGRTDNLVIDIE